MRLIVEEPDAWNHSNLRREALVIFKCDSSRSSRDGDCMADKMCETEGFSFAFVTHVKQCRLSNFVYAINRSSILERRLHRKAHQNVLLKDDIQVWFRYMFIFDVASRIQELLKNRIG